MFPNILNDSLITVLKEDMESKTKLMRIKLKIHLLREDTLVPDFARH